MSEFSDLVGLTLVDISAGDDWIEFREASGRKFMMDHNQNCCESVSVEEVIGDFKDLLNTPILVAEERTSHVLDPIDRVKIRIGVMEDQSSGESETWTFYELRTIKGSVTIRWYGTSNGYYSESVDFKEVPRNV